MFQHDDTSAPAQEVRPGRKVARPTPTNSGAVILADCSSSMDTRDGPGGWSDDPNIPRRIDRLAGVLGYILPQVRLQSLVAFHDIPVEVVLAKSEQGRGVLGVIDGSSPKGVEDEAGIGWRHELLRNFGYKR